MKVKEVAITVAVAILFTTLVIVTIDAFYPRPQYDDFCKSIYKAYPERINYAEQNCTYKMPAEEKKCYDDGGQAVSDYDESGCSVYKECSFCNKEFEEASKGYSNNYFLIIAPLGALAIIFGVFYAIEFLGSGFMYAGIILMFWGTVQNFEQLNKYLRIVVILAELLLVLFIAYKKIVPKSEFSVKKKRKH